MSFLNKYKYWINSAKYTSIQKCSVLFTGVITFMILARVLGPIGFGVWGLFILISSITETARLALIKNAYIRFINQYKKEEHSSLQSGVFVLNLIFTLLLVVGFYFTADWIEGVLSAKGLALIIKWYSLALVISLFFSHFETTLTAAMNFKAICYMYCFRQILMLLLIVSFLLIGVEINPVYLIWMYIASIATGAVIGYFFVRSSISLSITINKIWLGRIWHFGKYVFGNNIFSQLFRSTDNFLISSFFGVTSSALYNASLRISNLIDMPSTVLADILFPKVAQYNNTDKSSVKYMYERAVGATLIFSIPALLFLVLFPEFILKVLAGNAFLEAAPVLRITAVFCIFLPFLRQFGTVLDATGNPQLNFKVMCFGFFINLGLNIAGIYLFGFIGAAIGTLTTYFLLFLSSQVLLNKMFGITLKGVFLQTRSLSLEVGKVVFLKLKHNTR